MAAIKMEKSHAYWTF